MNNIGKRTRDTIYKCFMSRFSIESTQKLTGVTRLSIENLYDEFELKQATLPFDNEWVKQKNTTNNFVLITTNQEVLSAYNRMINKNPYGNQLHAK